MKIKYVTKISESIRNPYTVSKGGGAICHRILHNKGSQTIVHRIHPGSTTSPYQRSNQILSRWPCLPSSYLKQRFFTLTGLGALDKLISSLNHSFFCNYFNHLPSPNSDYCNEFLNKSVSFQATPPPPPPFIPLTRSFGQLCLSMLC